MRGLKRIARRRRRRAESKGVRRLREHGPSLFGFQRPGRRWAAASEAKEARSWSSGGGGGGSSLHRERLCALFTQLARHPYPVPREAATRGGEPSLCAGGAEASGGRAGRMAGGMSAVRGEQAWQKCIGRLEAGVWRRRRRSSRRGGAECTKNFYPPVRALSVIGLRGWRAACRVALRWFCHGVAGGRFGAGL